MAVSDYQALIEEASADFAVPAAWLQAIMQAESGGDPRAFRQEANDASYGLMQLLTRTAAGLGYTGAPEGLFDPAVNVRYGAMLIAQLRSQYGNDIRRVYSAYNSGRPDLYLTSSQVGVNVQRVLDYLAQFVEQQPAEAAAGAGLLIVLAMFWYWTAATKGK